jgi:hypothetical protein
VLGCPASGTQYFDMDLHCSSRASSLRLSRGLPRVVSLEPCRLRIGHDDCEDVWQGPRLGRGRLSFLHCEPSECSIPWRRGVACAHSPVSDSLLTLPWFKGKEVLVFCNFDRNEMKGSVILIGTGMKDVLSACFVDNDPVNYRYCKHSGLDTLLSSVCVHVACRLLLFEDEGFRTSSRWRLVLC